MFHKVLFASSAHGSTAGLVVDSQLVDITDVSALSRLFPAYEAPKMKTLHVSPGYADQADAFAHVFNVNTFGTPSAPGDWLRVTPGYYSTPGGFTIHKTSCYVDGRNGIPRVGSCWQLRNPFRSAIGDYRTLAEAKRAYDSLPSHQR
jgi:hypothetical protein